jgi:hypothetical protein
VTGTDEMDGGQIASVEQQKAIVEEYEKQPEFMGTLPHIVLFVLRLN